MKKSILFALIFHVCIVKAQSNYHRSFTQSNNTISEVVYANEYNTSSFVVSNFLGANAYEGFGMITKFTTTTGAITSSKTFSFTGNDITIKGVNKKNSALYIAASIGNPNPSASGTLIYKYNLSSNTITWKKSLYFDQEYTVQSITADNSKYLYILGAVFNATTSANDLCITKMDTVGNMLWSKSFGSDILDEYPSSILFNGNREIYVSSINFAGFFGNSTIIRLDSAGNIINSNVLTTSSGPRFGSMATTIFNNKLVIADNTIVGPGDQGPVLLRTLDSNLVSLNSKVISGLKVLSIFPSTSQLLVSGSAPVSNGYVGERSIRLDNNLNVVSSHHFNKMTTYSIASTNASFINSVNQSMHAFKPGGNDSLFVIKADVNESSGCRDSSFVPTVVTLNYTAGTYTYALFPITTTTASITIPINSYTVNSASLCTGITTDFIDNKNEESEINILPNPTSDKFFIYSGHGIHISIIKIVNALGQEVFHQNNGNEIDISVLQNGIYFLNLYDNNAKNIAVKKIYKF